jgi:hypothetical protein
VVGIIAQEDCNKEFFASYEPIGVEDFKLCLKSCSKEEKKGKELALSHPDLKYHLSPVLLGIVHQFLERNFSEVHVFAVKEKPGPFLFRATEMGKDYSGCAFIVAPYIF